MPGRQTGTAAEALCVRPLPCAELLALCRRLPTGYTFMENAAPPAESSRMLSGAQMAQVQYPFAGGLPQVSSSHPPAAAIPKPSPKEIPMRIP